MLQDGTPEMKEIAQTIVEGSEGFFYSQYTSIFKLSFFFAGEMYLLIKFD